MKLRHRLCSGRLPSSVVCLGLFLILNRGTVVAVSQEAAGSDSEAASGLLTVSEYVELAEKRGDPLRGARVFASHRVACVSCHRIGETGGAIGPELTSSAPRRTREYLVESVLFPKKHVDSQYVALMVVDSDGRQFRGYRVPDPDKPESTPSADDDLTLRDPGTGELRSFTADDIDEIIEVGTLMPDGMAAALSTSRLADVFALLFALRESPPQNDLVGSIAPLLTRAMTSHSPEAFRFEQAPLQPDRRRHAAHPVNRDRVYDFYRKQALTFRDRRPRPLTIEAFPGLDGGNQGHWGNQNDDIWKDNRWNEMVPGSLQAGVFRGFGLTIPRAICIRLGRSADGTEYSAVFDTDSLQYRAVWKDGFVGFSDIRHGFVGGLQPVGVQIESPVVDAVEPIRQLVANGEDKRYLGCFVADSEVAFHYSIDGTELVDTVSVDDGRAVRFVAEATAELAAEIAEDARQTQVPVFPTRIEHGADHPFALDTIRPPSETPWNSLMFFGGHAFLPDGSAVVCTMQGEVWKVTGFEYPSTEASWQRIAFGLHQPLGILTEGDRILVQGRDRISELQDRNADGLIDYVKSIGDAHATSAGGHDYICGLERDRNGNLYTASGNQGLIRFEADSSDVAVIAEGFRNPDGLGILSPRSPDDGRTLLTVPCSEGSWTPASMICGMLIGDDGPAEPLYFGFPGPRGETVPELPMVYLPRGLDNSAGGQCAVSGDAWRPLRNTMLHFSFGTGRAFLLLHDEVNGRLQGAVVPLPGDFDSGAHRGRFSPSDGQLYVTGMQGWGSYTPQDGCFQRMRLTSDEIALPVEIRIHENGVLLKFAADLDASVVENADRHFAQCWNYRYSDGYGSPEFAPSHFGMAGHDVPDVTAAVLVSPQELFLEIPDLQPVNQLHLMIDTGSDLPCDVFATIHTMHPPYPIHGAETAARRKIDPHPILADMRLLGNREPNPWSSEHKGARVVDVSVSGNLSFNERSLEAVAGEWLELRFRNDDVVPHNWALIRPGTLAEIGRQCNLLVGSPEAAAQQYVPDSGDVVSYTDITSPKAQQTIWFQVPEQPGTYPYLCTFPGHWPVMNGILRVTASE